MKAILIFPRVGDYFPQADNVHEIDIPEGVSEAHITYTMGGADKRVWIPISIPQPKRRVKKARYLYAYANIEVITCCRYATDLDFLEAYPKVTSWYRIKWTEIEETE